MAKSTRTFADVFAELESKGSEKTRKTYARHGFPAGRMFGVSNADLKAIAKTIRGRQEIALELYATGNVDAMYLAGIVADGSQMTLAQLQSWAEGAAGLSMIAEYTVPWVAIESSNPQELAMQWIGSEKEHVASSGWCTYSGLLATRADDELDCGEIQGLLEKIVSGIDGAPNRVRYTMNNFVISAGMYVKPLREQARAAAARIGTVSVEMGDTACKVRLASDYIQEMEATGRIGVKRKTIRC